MYDLDAAGAIDYPETENYSYDIWHCTPGLTDASEYKSVRFQMLQENLLLHWKYAYLEIHGRLVKRQPGLITQPGLPLPQFLMQFPIFLQMPNLLLELDVWKILTMLDMSLLSCNMYYYPGHFQRKGEFNLCG